VNITLLSMGSEQQAPHRQAATCAELFSTSHIRWW